MTEMTRGDVVAIQRATLAKAAEYLEGLAASADTEQARETAASRSESNLPPGVRIGHITAAYEWQNKAKSLRGYAGHIRRMRL